MATIKEQKKVLLDIKKELANSKLFVDVNYPKDSESVENYIWIGDKEKLIGMYACHYEFIFHPEDSDYLSVEVHISEKGKQKLFQNLQFTNALEFAEWYGHENGRVIVKKSNLYINTPNIAKKAIKKLKSLHNEIGEQLQEILLDNQDLLPKKNQISKPVLSPNNGTIVKKKNYKERTAATAKSLETMHGKIQEAYKLKLLKSNQYSSIKEEQYFDRLPYRIDLLACSKSGNNYDVFEIKPGSTATECIREALGQLLFYKHLLEKGDYKVNRIVVVGPIGKQPSDDEYLESINKEMDEIKIEYDYVLI